MKTSLNHSIVLLFAIFGCVAIPPALHGQAIKVNTAGTVGINGEPSVYYSLTVHGKIRANDYISTSGNIYTNGNINLAGNNSVSGLESLNWDYDRGGIVLNDPDALVKIQGGTESVPSVGLYVDGSIQYTGDLSDVSDGRLKKDIEPLDGLTILEKIRTLEAKKYRFKSREELIGLHRGGDIRFSVDTVNLYSRAKEMMHLDMSMDKASVPGTDEQKKMLKEQYVEKAKKGLHIEKMINDSLALVVHVPNFKKGMEYGLISQKVMEAGFPELVRLDSTSGIYTLNYVNFVPILISAINAIQDKYGQQEDKITALEAELQQLKNQLQTRSADAGNVDLPGGQAMLYQNTPNPFIENTEIRYFLDDNVAGASLYIYNMAGVQIKAIPLHEKGNASITIQGSELKAGMYMYTLIADGREIDTKRMILTD